MLKFSYRGNVTDENKLKSELKATVRLIRNRYPDFQYVAVREFHDSEKTSEAKRGSGHLHMAVIRLVNWYIHEILLAGNSKGAVNVRAPSKYWGGQGNSWKSDKLSGYLTKYIHKDFENSAKGAKRYWHTKGIEPIKVMKFWLGNIWLPGTVPQFHQGRFVRPCPF